MVYGDDNHYCINSKKAENVDMMTCDGKLML